MWKCLNYPNEEKYKLEKFNKRKVDVRFFFFFFLTAALSNAKTFPKFWYTVSLA